MRLLIIYILLFCCCNNITAQIIKKEAGRISANDVYLCNYVETGKAISTLDINVNCTGNLSLPEPNDFKDYIFSNADGEQLIYATAMVLSSPNYTYLRYCYKIDFLFADTSVYLLYKYSIIDYFLKSASHFKVLQNGVANKDAVNDLISYWLKTVNGIEPEYVSNGSTCHYNASPYNVEENYDTSYTVSGENIYKDGIWVGKFKSSWKLEKLHQSPKSTYYYTLQDTTGKHIGEVQIYHQFADVWIWPYGIKNYLSMYSPVREESKIIALAMKFLIIYNAGQVALSNNK